MVHVLEVLLEEGDVDDFAGGEGGVVESGSEGLGVGVTAVAWDFLLVGEEKGCKSVGEEKTGDLERTSGGAIGDLGGAGTAKRCGVRRTVWEAVECEFYIRSRGAS